MFFDPQLTYFVNSIQDKSEISHEIMWVLQIQIQAHKAFALLCNEGLVSKDPSCDTCAPYRSFFPDHHFSCRLLVAS